MRIAARKLLKVGLFPARVNGGKAVGIAPTESLKLRRQMAAAARKKESVFGDAGDDAPSPRNLTCAGASVTTKGR